MSEPVIYATRVLGEDGVIRDLAKFEFLPSDVMAINAWTEIRTPIPAAEEAGDEEG